MSFDLSQLDTHSPSKSGVDMPIPRGPGGPSVVDEAGKPVTIRLLGPNCDKFREQVRARQAMRTDMASRGIKRTLEDDKAENFEYLVALTIGWSDNLVVDGAPFPFTPESVRRLWADSRWGWLTIVAINFAFDESRFLAKSPASPGG